MPLYEYQCRGCGERFEELVSGTSQPLCPGCQGEDLEKLPSAFAVGTGRPTTQGGPACPSCPSAGSCGMN